MKGFRSVRLPLAVAALGLLSVFVVPGVRAQVVIRERVEVRPDGAGSPIATTAWTGGVRGSGTLRFYFSKALLRMFPLSSLSATLTTTAGQVVDLPLTAAAQGGPDQAVCLRTEAYPNWPECSQWSYNPAAGGLLATVHLAPDENPGTLALSGPGFTLSLPVSLQAPPNQGYNKFDNIQLNCGYHYYAWGPYHFADCDCMADRTDEIHGQISFRWEFAPDPATRLLVTAAPVLHFKPTLPWSASVNVQAAYADGAPAPLAKGTALTFTASSTAYGSLYEENCYYGCKFTERGATVQNGYQGNDRVSYRADGIDGSGGQATQGPVCDTPVTVSVTGGGLQGDARIVLRGSSTDATPDTLLVLAAPDPLAAGDTATVVVFAQNRDGCDLSDTLPDTTRMAVTVTPAINGTLEYNGVRAAAFRDVPFGDLRNGRLRFVANADIATV